MSSEHSLERPALCLDSLTSTRNANSEIIQCQPIIYDGTCGACQEGYINCCDGNGFVGLSGTASINYARTLLIRGLGWGGGLSEHVVLPRHAIVHIPKSIPLEVGGETAYRITAARLIRSQPLLSLWP